MRTLLAILAFLTLLTGKAQSHLPVYPWGLGYSPWQAVPFLATPYNFNPAQKWQFVPSAGISAGYIFMNGGGTSFLSAPLALTLYHPLTNNVTAFAAVSATPTVFHTGTGYVPSPLHQPFAPNSYAPGYGLSVNAAVGGGLMYTNDAHTFSVSGSVWMQQSEYPVNPMPRHPNGSKQ